MKATVIVLALIPFLVATTSDSKAQSSKDCRDALYQLTLEIFGAENQLRDELEGLVVPLMQRSLSPNEGGRFASEWSEAFNSNAQSQSNALDDAEKRICG